MKIAFQNVFWWLLFWAYNYNCLAKDSVTIGALFNNPDSQAQMALRSTVYANNLLDENVYYKINMQIVSPSDSFSCSKILCNITELDNGVAAIFGPESKTTTSIIESICSDFEIPHLQTNWRHSSSHESQTTLNFFPEASLFAQGLAVIVKNLQWKKFVVLYEDEEGLIRLQEVLKLQEYDRDNHQNNIVVKQLNPGSDQRTLLKEIKNSTETKIILDCNSDNIINVLQQAKEVHLLELFNSFFITSLDAHTLDYSILNTSANITTVRLFNPKEQDFVNAVNNWELVEYHHGNRIVLTPNMIKVETALMHDAVKLFIDSLNTLKVTTEINTQPISCKSSDKWPGGFSIVSYMKVKQPLLSLTGPLKFDENGKRIDFLLHVIEVIEDKMIATWSPTAGLNFSRSESENVRAVVENLQKTLVIVSSRIGEPYLRHRAPKYEGEILTGNARYEGYSMDLIAAIAANLNFTFEFRLAADGKYGNWDPEAKSWNGLVKDLLDRRAHLAVCDLSITHQRREVVDFSMPFMTVGISILYKKPEKKDVDKFAFLNPLSKSVWIYTAALYLGVSIILYFIARMAPGDWENPHPCNENPEELENIWDLKNCCWLTLGSIMTQGCDILPKGVSSRMAVSMWWFFSLIMTSSYTANLAAFLTMERMEPTIDSAEALAKQTKIKYGTVEGGATQAFFRDSNYSTYERMWINMLSSKPGVFEKNNAEGVNRVQTTRNSLYAFLMESSQIEYEVETKCNLKQVGNWLDSKGLGIAMPVNSPYLGAINKAVLTMQEEGKLNELKIKWWKKMRTEPSCADSSHESESSNALALANVGGVFLVLGFGVAIAFFLAFVEFLWNVRNVSVEEHISYWEALKLELKFACTVWVTKKRTKVQPSTASSSSAGSSGKGEGRKSVARSILHGATSFINLNVINKIGSTININDNE